MALQTSGSRAELGAPILEERQQKARAGGSVPVRPNWVLTKVISIIQTLLPRQNRDPRPHLF